jgi:hypothetical protein
VIIASATGSSGRLSLEGGTLVVAGTIATGSATNGLFTFSGGTLAAGAIDATRITSGTGTAQGTIRVGTHATVAPGDVGTAGRTTVTGSLAFDAGTLAIDLGGATAATGFQTVSAAHDRLAVSGGIVLDNAGLVLSLLDQYDPAWLEPHTIASAASITGRFHAIDGIEAGGVKRLAVTYTATSAVVTAAAAGDMNLDGLIDVLDTAVFIATGAYDSGVLATWKEGDFNGDGLVDILDAADLSSHGLFNAGPYGAIAASGPIAAVPEPSFSIVVIAVAGFLGIRAFFPRPHGRSARTGTNVAWGCP